MEAKYELVLILADFRQLSTGNAYGPKGFIGLLTFYNLNDIMLSLVELFPERIRGVVNLTYFFQKINRAEMKKNTLTNPIVNGPDKKTLMNAFSEGTDITLTFEKEGAQTETTGKVIRMTAGNENEHGVPLTFEGDMHLQKTSKNDRNQYHSFVYHTNTATGLITQETWTGH